MLPRKSGLDWDSPIPGTYALVGGLVIFHLISGWSLLETVGPWLAWIGTRTMSDRVLFGGQITPLIEQGEWWRFVTSVVVHGGGVHLVVNGLALLTLGRLLEPIVGPRRLWAWFFMGGVGGSLCSYGVGVLQSDGASGGAFALLMIAFMWGVRRRQELSPEDYRILVPVLGSFIVINMVLSWVIPILDIAGHFGGVLVGALVGMVMSGDDNASILVLWLERGWNFAVCLLLIFGFLVW